MAHDSKVLSGCALCLTCLLGSPAFAQIEISADEAIDGFSDDDDVTDDQEHARGTYTGVEPGGDQLPAIPIKPGEGKCVITWPGFQMRPDGSSRFFIQSTRPLTLNPQTFEHKIVIELSSANIAGETNRLPLETKYFNTPVTRATIVGDGKSTRLVLEMRAFVQPNITSEQAKSGFHFVYIDFPAGNYLGQPAGEAKAGGETSKSTGPTRHIDKPISSAKDDELPPGMGKVKGKSSASASGSASAGKGKAKTKGKAKAGLSL